MDKIKIGINGFGRIGRIVLRESLERDTIEVVAINDLLDPEHMAYLLRYDSVHGRFKGTVEAKDGNLLVNGRLIRVTAQADPTNLKWDEAGAEIVAECTGLILTRELAEKHLMAGAKKVIISSPSADVPVFVMGVNHQEIKSSDLIISNASCTTNCLAPLAKILNDNFGIVEGLMTTIHATTATQKTVDGATKKDYRGGRAALLNTIPATTGAAKAVSKVIPELKGKLTGIAMRVPVADVSVVDLTVKLAKETSYEAIMELCRESSMSDRFQGIMGYTEDDVVSQDFVSDKRTCIIDAKAGLGLNPTFFKIVAWYDNEYGYSSKLLDMVSYAGSLR